MHTTDAVLKMERCRLLQNSIDHTVLQSPQQWLHSIQHTVLTAYYDSIEPTAQLSSSSLFSLSNSLSLSLSLTLSLSLFLSFFLQSPLYSLHHVEPAGPKQLNLCLSPLIPGPWSKCLHHSILCTLHFSTTDTEIESIGQS